jgi:hypothetical protein
MTGSVAGTIDPEVSLDADPSTLDESSPEVEASEPAVAELEPDASEPVAVDDVAAALLARTDLDVDGDDDLLATAPLVIVPAVVDEDAAPSEAVSPDEAPAPKRRLATFPRHRRPRVRRVTRVIRSVDPWTIFKLALVVNAVLYAATLLSLVLLWNVATATGTIDNVERFLESFGWDSFEFRGGELYHATWIIGLFLVVLGTGLWVLAAVVFNLVTDLVGGIRVTVLEEEVVVRDEPGRRG